MRRLLLTLLVATMAFAVLPAQRLTPPDGFTVIDEQPEGELRIYTRHGMKRSESQDGSQITTEAQTGTVNIVFAADGQTVYIQRPVNDSYYDGWIRGTLSADGSLLTVPLGQYTAYTRSFDMAVQVHLMVYDEVAQTYVADTLAEAVTYAIDPDGTMTLQGTDEHRLLGVVNRAFGTTFSYLDYEWLGHGDYETVYTLYDEALQSPPASLQTKEYITTTGSYDGIGWVAYEGTARLGFQGNVAWLQGLSGLLPRGWIRGTRSGKTVTFPAGQLVGSYFNVLRYLVCAEPDAAGNPVVTDLVLTEQADGSYTTCQDILLSASRTDVADFAAYYMGMTLATEPDRLVEAPEGLETVPYTVNYKSVDDAGLIVQYRDTLQAGAYGDADFYLRGVAPWLPEALVRGTIDAGRVVFASPQYLGVYTEEGEGSYPFFFQAFSPTDGQLLPSVAFDYDAASGTLSHPTAAIGVGIDKTGWLISLTMLDPVFAPSMPSAVRLPGADASMQGVLTDLQGRVVAHPRHGLYICDGQKVIVGRR